MLFVGTIVLPTTSCSLQNSQIAVVCGIFLLCKYPLSMVKQIVWSLTAKEEGHLAEAASGCNVCSRFSWADFDTSIRSTETAVEHINKVMESMGGTMGYFGVTWSPLDRCHKIREREGADAAHFPKWSCCSPLMFGPLSAVLVLEKYCVTTLSA